MIKITKPVVTNIEFLEPEITISGQTKYGTRSMRVYFAAIDSDGNGMPHEDVTKIYEGQEYNDVCNGDDFKNDKTLVAKVLNDESIPADLSTMPDNLSNPLTPDPAATN
jgi:hypothetical protein